MRVQWLVIVRDAIAGNGGTISEVIVATLTTLYYQMQLYDINTHLDASFVNHPQDFNF